MPSKTDWLVEIAANYDDSDWFEENAEQVYSTISRKIRSPETLIQAVDTLLMVFPSVVNREDLKRWSKLLKDALVIFRDEENARRNQPEDFYILIPREKRVRLTRTKRRPRDKVVGFEMLETYLILLMGIVYNHPERLTPQRAQDIFHLGRVVNDSYLYHKLYQTLALIYNQKREFERAQNYAEFALRYFQQRVELDSRLQIDVALTAYALGIALSGKQEWDKALALLEQAGSLFARLDNPLQYGVAALGASRVHIARQQYDAAEQAAQIALRELQAVKANYYVAVVYHHLGTAQAYQGRVQDARASLNEALLTWQHMGNLREEAGVQYTLAWLEARAGSRDAALEHIGRCGQIFGQLPADDWRKSQEAETRRLGEAIEKNKVASFVRAL